MDEKDPEHMEHTKSLEQMLENARSATEKEHKMTLMQGVKLYPKAIFWSVLISSTIIMVCLPSASGAQIIRVVADRRGRKATTSA